MNDNHNSLRGREKFHKYKKIINVMCKLSSFLPKSFRSYLFQLFRMKKGKSGLAIRYILMKTLAIQCGDNVSIHPGVYILKPDNLKIGNNVSIHPMCYIDATGHITIGNDVSIAHGVTIMSTSHMYTEKGIPIKDQPITYEKTTIDNDIWIGAKATILAGISISKGSVIAAGAVVTKSLTMDNIIVAGVPATTLKFRN